MLFEALGLFSRWRVEVGFIERIEEGKVGAAQVGVAAANLRQAWVAASVGGRQRVLPEDFTPLGSRTGAAGEDFVCHSLDHCQVAGDPKRMAAPALGGEGERNVFHLIE